MTYRAPVRDLAFTLQAVAGIDQVAATGAFPDYWLFALGGLFIFVTLFMPKGIVGSLKSLIARLRLWRESGTPKASGPSGTPLVPDAQPNPAE
mgnify:CR=1 FL=1